MKKEKSRYLSTIRKTILLFFFIVIILIFTLLFFRKSEEKSLIDKGNEVIVKVDSFRNVNKRLPNSLSELGILEKEEGPIYYEKKDSLRYIIWFGTTFGESEIYDSEKKKWN